ncbi:bacillithiol biosynthesis cysteine-adding enzyme BshC [Chitinophaga terrae (ex Kim and Jung 2007)]|uniref:Putative cysteine ligase BshC n=1 Tax=Chitinophaga terrae (ex Kim and Jung 2007) TaxID=408074 RepID=A0A1H4ALE8_9BACT|nr:bacillithiol biosynthesis cysteine-adding enzyme BshC [Chitinophaga terrae (ex Kim and Jung 2007)]GEP89276.1 putative cysteine ligase BshC [Chitinophaga terrae (ex Kim and Jung 2007)]SEA36598.1 bacillithiol biosynthesis cysteine-adding enzyme BshC [Chitinophaga terrae (ex Kim and Jung 2007)]
MLEYIPYGKTGYFTQLVTDFLEECQQIRPFYKYSPTRPDFSAAIAAREQFNTPRAALVQALTAQYSGLNTSKQVQDNISSLLQPGTFTVCTAHQPNIFTGYLYFVYKILQTIKLAKELKEQYPDRHFVPVYYMGSEDADLDELGSIYIDGKTLTWATDQQGPVGKMEPASLEPLITSVKNALGYAPHAAELIELLQKAYLEHDSIQTATLYLVNELFGRFGLVVLVPDNPALKELYIPVMRDELLNQVSYGIVNDTLAKLPEQYKVQANPREINLFYLEKGLRERIVKQGNEWKVLHTALTFDESSLEKELTEHPEKFSPNVILRGMFQETILPNIAFIGGGGEIAYWLELQQLFEHYKVPYPILLLRNSLLLVDEFSQQRLKKLELQVTDLFQPTEEIVTSFVKKHTNTALVLKDEYEAIEKLYDGLEEKARSIDITLVASVGAERKRALKSIGKLEHKYLKAEKKKFAWQGDQIRQLRSRLFPGNSLQERKENFMPWYAQEGPAFLDRVYEALKPVTDQFIILEE